MQWFNCDGEKKLIKLIRIATGRLSKLFLGFVLTTVAKCVSARLDLLFQRSAFQWRYLRSITLLWRRWNDLAALWMRPTAAGRRFAGAITVGTKPNRYFGPPFAYANLRLWGSILIVQHRDSFSSWRRRRSLETRREESMWAVNLAETLDTAWCPPDVACSLSLTKLHLNWGHFRCITNAMSLLFKPFSSMLF